MTERFLKPGAAWVLLGAPGLALLLWLMQRGLRALGNRGGTASEGLLLGLLIGIFLAVAVAYLWSTRLLGRSTATVRHQPALLRVLEFQVRRLAARVLGRRGERWFGWALNAPYENQALAYLDEAARCGNVEALLELGLYWRDAGLGLGGDASARAWFRRAAELGHGEAAFHLAECLRWGRGGLREPQEAHRWYLRAAQRGFGPAADWLARAYAEGDGVSADPEEAARWADRAASGGPMPTPRRSRIAGRWDGSPELLGRAGERAAEAWRAVLTGARGHRAFEPAVKGLAWTGIVLMTLALAGLLWIITFGGLFMIPGVVAFAGLTLVWLSLRRGNWSRDLQRLERRSEAGDPEACFRRGLAFLEGRHGLPRDPVMAQSWILRAAQAGHRGAMHKLSELLAWGVAGPRDPAGAEAWRREAEAAEAHP